MDAEEFQAWVAWLHQQEVEHQRWLRRVAEEETDWNALLSVPTRGDN